MSYINQNGQDHDSEVLPLSVRRYDYKDKDQFAQILTLERERLLDSMRHSREISDIDTGSGRSEQEPATEITEYIIFSIDPTTFNQDFLSVDAIPNFSIRTIRALHRNPGVYTEYITDTQNFDPRDLTMYNPCTISAYYGFFSRSNVKLTSI